MAGRINAEDVATVKERSSIEEVVREHVTLRAGGYGALKGLCPFHDEKTPSFNVRPAVGSYHCFGCGEGGDVISFVQKIDHLTFSEAVERLAARLGMELRYDEGGPRRDEGSLGRRSRLLEAHRVAEEFYAAALLGLPEARAGRDFLRARGFDSAAAKRFGVGYAPRAGEALTRHLRDRGFSTDELTASGLSGQGSRGLYDRFRGRLVWPIRDITGDTVGFGARRLFDDDRQQAKYLNTSETAIYKKSSVLYGLDLAKKAIATARQVVVVEGYTDVMAAHLAGVETAVATCGTAFGAEHIKILRRIVRDEAGGAPARVVFTFDGDAAGQKAAMRAFQDDQRWAAQSFVAVAPDGMDPCELRLAKGDPAVQHLVEDAVPLFEFAIRTTLRRFDLDTAEGRIGAARAAAPIIAEIRDGSLRPEYVRQVAGWLGVEIEQMQHEVARAQRRAREGGGPAPEPAAGLREAASEPAGPVVPVLPAPDLRDPVVVAERQFLQAVLQFPSSYGDESLSVLPEDAFSAPAHRAVFEGVRAALPGRAGLSKQAWVAAVQQATTLVVQPLVAELAVAPLPIRLDDSGAPPRRYLEALLVGVHDAVLTRRIADVMALVRRLQGDPAHDPGRLREHTLALTGLELQRARLRDALQ